jgi:hypothetical protein
VQDLSLFAFGVEEWDFIISIFCHTKPDARSRILDKAAIGLKRGGFFILEGYNLSQAQKDSGGPKDIDMLFSLERDVLPVFGDFQVICSENKTRFISEGTLHVGDSSVCRFLAQKHL